MGAQDGFAAIRRQVNLWLNVSRSRRALAALDDRMLSDVGLNRAQATTEALRPFYDTVHKVDTPARRADEDCATPQMWRTA